MRTYSWIERLLFPPTVLNREKLGRELAGKTVLITGASSGIGKQLARMLAEFNVPLDPFAALPLAAQSSVPG